MRQMHFFKYFLFVTTVTCPGPPGMGLKFWSKKTLHIERFIINEGLNSTKTFMFIKRGSQSLKLLKTFCVYESIYLQVTQIKFAFILFLKYKKKVFSLLETKQFRDQTYFQRQHINSLCCSSQLKTRANFHNV